ncbi:MAG: pilus assembly protein PilM [Candidatus Paceibacterota bacterium]
MVFKKIFDTLPPPKLLNIPYFAVSVSDKNIRCIYLSNRGQKIELVKSSEYSIPEGVISGGHIENMDEFSNILKKIKKEFGLNYVRMSISEEKAYLFKTKIPIVKRKEVRDAIESTLEDNVPVPAEELVFDFVVNDKTDLDDSLDVVVVALPVKIVDSYVEAVSKAGLSMISLEIESQAISQSLLSRNDRNTNIIIYLNDEKMSVYVVNNSIVHFTSTTSIKGNIKDNVPFISQEVRKIRTYWKSLEGSSSEDSIEEVIICGDFVEEDVISQISVNIKMPVVLGNVWTNVYNLDKSVPDISFKDSLKFAPAIGLALPEDLLI